jgi:hypothetical protein
MMNRRIQSLRKQIAEIEENMRLIAERKSEYVQETDIPVQLIKEERRLEARLAELQTQLRRTEEQPAPPEKKPRFVNVWLIATAGVAIATIVFVIILNNGPSQSPPPTMSIPTQESSTSPTPTPVIPELPEFAPFLTTTVAIATMIDCNRIRMN